MSAALESARVKSRGVGALKLDLKTATVERDDAIRKAYAAGATIAELARATGLTRAMLYRILDTARTPGGPDA